MNKKRFISALGAAVFVFAATQSANAQFFTNDLTDATSVFSQFTTNCGPDGVWSFTTDYAIAQDGSTNSVLQGGAVIGLTATSNDADSARSYVMTVHSNYANVSWKAHIGVETVNVNPKNFIFFGMGAGTPNPNDNYEPTNGDHVYVAWQSGNSSSKIRAYANNSVIYDTGAWQGDPGYDIYMTYNHLHGTIQFEVDNWNGGRYSDIDQDTGLLAVSSYLSDTNNMHIFFGGNATMTFRDFDIYEIIPDPVPATPQNLYAWPETNNAAAVYWDDVASADGYTVYRSLDDVESNYVAIATGVLTNSYTDTNVTAGVTYYYKASATNAMGESELSNSEFAMPNKYYIFGVMYNSGASVARWYYELFDRNLDTFCDDNSSGGYAGLDYGEGNGKEIVQVAFRLRNDAWGRGSDGTLVIDGVTNSVSRSQKRSYLATFEGSENGVDWAVLASITNIAALGEWNECAVTDATAYRYVRYNSAPSGWNNYALADVAFYSADDFTANGTPVMWLEGYGLTAGDDEVDTDLDGLKNYEEYIAGTVPTNSASVLELNSVEVTTNGVVVSWQSVEGKSYSLYADSSIGELGAEDVVTNNIAGLDTETSYTATASGADTMFYKVGVE